MFFQHLDEIVVPGLRLGRNIKHDPRSLRYPFRAANVTLTSHRWSTSLTPILDQGNLGSCTGNAVVGSLLCEKAPLWLGLPADLRSTLNEDLAVHFYSRGTEVDDYQGTYPPEDTGSDGLSVAKAADEHGYIHGYSHAFSLNDALAALTIAPVIIGIDWYDGFDNPSTDGLISISGYARGGHEVCLDEIDVPDKLVWLRNSWSADWGVNGRACMSWNTLGDLLENNGDATVLNPLTVPAPVPIPPTPVPPTPTPSPTPDPTPSVDTADLELAEVAGPWSAHRKLSCSNEKLRKELLYWLSAKGL